jgi:fluoroquinolone transport system ATP-binding protein
LILRAHDLEFTYPKADRPAIRGLDFHVEEGEVFGFLGPNGSGKSTTQKVLTRILHGYRGEVEVGGRNLREQGTAYYNTIGVCFEFPNLYGKLTAEENLDFYRAFFDVATADARAMLRRLDLPVADRRPVSQYSKGMKMRLVLARSLLNRPRLWFLDEPTTGQDPQHAVLIRRLIREKAREGTTVFLTTHDMTVADELCDRVAFIVEGELVAEGSPRELKLRHARKVVRVEYRDGGEKRSRDLNLEDEGEREELIDVIGRGGIETMHTQEPSLEDVFLKVTGRELG